ncbi:helix-turn-helix transcriptional regulator [Corynebacterium guangdongense]|uniref:AraC-like DNA-binding protein n=1 Tax=Corynebacterium guangdongense TaxID=1783348 RepID=A0ABU1ZUG3_9CORY|nr:AraC family transcriptional regulator [Corynebacterium guangdongense]MDR7328567.1 AraC-like DNA-binding protein [Corynebacterium guangdongense]WJZ17144.1 Transcriptional activator NphR [Corynebacterium guangdongense]
MNTNDNGPGRQASRLVNFSTGNLPVSDRVELWERHNGQALIPLDIRTLEEAPMMAAQSNLILPSMRMANVNGTSQIVERNEAFIREHPTGVIAIFFALGGEAFFMHRGGMLTIKPGQAVIYPGDRPFTRGFPGGLRELVMTIPEADFAEAFGFAVDKLPFVFDFGPSTGATEQALPRLVSNTLRSGLADAPALAKAEENLHGLLHRALNASNSSSAGLVATAKDVIERSFADPTLTVTDIAAAVGISERQLSRAFAEQDSSLAGYLRARRVALAQSLLVDARHRDTSIAEVAARCGFSSQSAFTRVFKELTGQPPLQWRKTRPVPSF